MRRLKEIVGWVACCAVVLVCVLGPVVGGIFLIKTIDDSHVARRSAAGEVQYDGFSAREVTIGKEQYIVFQSSRGIHVIKKESTCVTH